MLVARITRFLLVTTLFLASAHDAPASGGEYDDLKRTFETQVIVSLDAQATVSPSSAEESDWTADPRWRTRQHVASVFVLVHMSPALIDAAVEYWAAGKPDVDPDKKAAALNKLREQYLKKGQRAFFLLVKPIVANRYQDQWAVKIGPVRQNISLVSLDGKRGRIISAETTVDRLLDGTSGVKTCLFWVEDTVVSSEPSFNIEVNNIYYFIKPTKDGQHKLDYDRRRHPHTVAPQSEPGWFQARGPKRVFFRVETNGVNILRLIQNGVPWKEIEERYVRRELRFASASGHRDVARFISDVAVELIVGLLLKAI